MEWVQPQSRRLYLNDWFWEIFDNNLIMWLRYYRLRYHMFKLGSFSRYHTTLVRWVPGACFCGGGGSTEKLEEGLLVSVITGQLASTAKRLKRLASRYVYGILTVVSGLMIFSCLECFFFNRSSDPRDFGAGPRRRLSGQSARTSSVSRPVAACVPISIRRVGEVLFSGGDRLRV